METIELRISGLLTSRVVGIPKILAGGQRWSATRNNKTHPLA